ncbi:hypothetical protein [Saccharothrix sp. Mg75]|uniref:hypothetical protein n=1 Tax=Saccharothrix sp. Mg75 TaxID=3445357 RepID=UPI003EF009DD
MTKDRPLRPAPFHDGSGFPIPLLRLRDAVRARGGDVEGGGSRWVLTHPDDGLPDVVVVVSDDGDVVVDAGDGRVLDVFRDEAWVVHDPARGWTHLEDDLLAVLDGGFTREEWFDGDGRRVAWAVRLVGPHVDEAGGTAGAVEASWARRSSTYPAWPAPRHRA